jgi:hypothetical protein
MKLEVDFFAAQPYTPKPLAVNLLVVDFDDTCTQEDTTALIARAAVATAARRAHEASGLAASAAEMDRGEALLHGLVRNYMSKRDALLEEILPEQVRFEGGVGQFFSFLAAFVSSSCFPGQVKAAAVSSAASQFQRQISSLMRHLVHQEQPKAFSLLPISIKLTFP